MQLSRIVRGRRLDWLLPPELRDGDRRRKARGKLLGLIMCVTLVSGLFLSGLFSVVFDTPFLVATILAGTSGFGLALALLRVTGRVRLVGHFSSFVLAATLVFAAFATGGARSPALAWMALVPIYSVFVTGRYGGYVWLAIAVFAIGGYFLVGLGLETAPSLEDWQWRLLGTFAHGILTVVVFAALISFEEFLRHLEEANVRFERMAHRDVLTELPNRRSLENRLTEVADRARRAEESISAGLFDIDNFKAINDTYGHEAGDQLLEQVAHRLDEVTRDEGFVGRLGGDEFVAILPGMTTPNEFSAVVRRIEESFEKPFSISDQETEIGLSMGFAVVTPEVLRAGDLDGLSRLILDEADRAMYEAKTDPESTWRLRAALAPDIAQS